MNNFIEFFEKYTFILGIGFIMGVLFILKGYERVQITSKLAHARYVISGIVGSMFITWLGYELFLFIGLPNSFSVALGGLLAYLGADKIADVFEHLLYKKLGIKRGCDETKPIL